MTKNQNQNHQAKAQPASKKAGYKGKPKAIKAEKHPQHKNQKTEQKIEQEPTLDQELTAAIEEATQPEAEAKPVKGEVVTVVNETDFLIGEREYKLVANHREGFDAEKLGERYSEVLARYDYVVGDWGYEQLRLKGFFEADDRKAQPDQRIDTLQDYLYEFCNFGCAYFVIKRIGGKREKSSNRRRHTKRPTEGRTTQNPEATQANANGNKPGGSGKPGAKEGNRTRDKRQRGQGKTNPQKNGQAHIKERKEDLSKRHKPVITKRVDKPAETKKTTTETSQEKSTAKGSKRGFVIKQREE